MKKTKIHLFLIIMITFAGLLLTADSIMEEWEFWVNPILIGGLILIWILHIGQLANEKVREVFFMMYVMFLAFFHGVHPSSFLDVCSVISLCMVLFSLYDRMYVLNLFLGEYFLLMALQFYYIYCDETLFFDPESITRYILQLFIVVSVFAICRMMITGRLEQAEQVIKAKNDKEQNDLAMEDFLSNISHELRTPVNVVNGMSMLMLKQGESSEITAIKNAGLRLSYQIEDIQDYTEVKRNKMILEDENYMITSLINDMVTDFRRYSDKDDIEFVIDLDPNVPAMMKGDVKKLKKMLRHLLDNALKFTKQGGIYIKVFAIPRDYGVNLTIEVTDTGIGMKRKDISMVSSRIYQANRKRNRSSGGIGLGLAIVYGMAHKMGGFVKIDAQVGTGTTVRVTVPQTIVDTQPCLKVDLRALGDIIFHVRAGKYRVPAVRQFYRDMATNLATGIRKPLFSADNIEDVKKLMEKMNVSHIFMGEEEYEEDREFFDELSKKNITVAVSARGGFKADDSGNVIVMPKPLYGFPVVKVLNGERLTDSRDVSEKNGKLLFENIRALIVDDEPMNLVVATGLFRDYKMITDTAESGFEAIEKFVKEEYDIVFMDHMMPEMDGVEAMKRLKEEARRQGRGIIVVALTANAVSGAREMFLKEGFDGFIAKPIDVAEFERVMRRVLGNRTGSLRGGSYDS